jgi:nucleoid-associated protein YgaU
MTPNREIPSFFLGGVVPKEAVGAVLEALYLAGAQNMQVDPVQSLNGSAPKERLPKAPRTPALPAPGKTGAFSEAALRLVTAAKGQPVPVKQIAAAIDAAGGSGKGASTLMRAFIKRGLIRRAGPGMYALANAAPTKPPKAKGYGAGLEIIRQYIRQQTKPFTRADVKAANLVPSGSLGPCLLTLMESGEIKRMERGLYVNQAKGA